MFAGYVNASIVGVSMIIGDYFSTWFTSIILWMTRSVLVYHLAFVLYDRESEREKETHEERMCFSARVSFP